MWYLWAKINLKRADVKGRHKNNLKPNNFIKRIYILLLKYSSVPAGAVTCDFSSLEKYRDNTVV